MRASHRAHNSVATLGDGDVGSDGEDEEGDEGEELGDAGMVDIDLLGGLAGGELFVSFTTDYLKWTKRA